jgi:PAS domain S-box-containing protein
MDESEKEPSLEGALWDLVRTTSVTSGEPFFLGLARTLAAALDLEIVTVAEIVEPPHLARTLAVWADAAWQQNLDYDMQGTPCALVHDSHDIVSIERGARERFPQDETLVEWKIESYIGAPLVGATGETIGHLCGMSTRPLSPERRSRLLLRTFASRAGAELERMRTERELKRQRDLLRQVLDINPSIIFVKDREGRFLLVNKALAEVYGTTNEELLGKTDADFNPNVAEVEFFRRKDLEVMDTRQEHVIPEEPVTEAGGRVRWVQTIKRPITGPDGRADLVLGVATDITELKRAREELVSRQEREQQRIQAELDRAKRDLVLQTRLAAIGQIAASIAHELRNPLGAIHNAVFYLRRREGPLEPKWDQYMHIIRQEVLAADRIVSDLLEMTRAKEPDKHPVDVGHVAQEVFGRLPRTVGLRLVLELDPDPFVVQADPQQLRQVLANLFTNSIQALEAPGRILLRGVREDGADRMLVADDGPGIAAEIRDRLFEPLVTTKAKGTGLGLVICRQILERHGGSIELAASPRGAAFELRFPRP